MPVIVPLTDDASQTFVMNTFSFNVYWNDIASAWFMDLAQNGITFIQGLKMLMGVLLLNVYNLGVGDFIVARSDAILQDPERTAWSAGFWNLVYYTQGELNALSS